MRSTNNEAAVESSTADRLEPVKSPLTLWSYRKIIRRSFRRLSRLFFLQILKLNSYKPYTISKSFGVGLKNKSASFEADFGFIRTYQIVSLLVNCITL